MPEEVRVWQVDRTDVLTEVKRSRLNLEARIEKWIIGDVSLLKPELLIIGEQVATSSGNFIDLLCIDSSGNLVIVELKRDKTPREVTAQALDYASWVKELDLEGINTIAKGYLKGQTLAVAFQSKFGGEIPEVLNEHHAMLVVASEIDDSTERIIRYLSETYGVDINAVRFQFFQAQDGREFLVRTFTVPALEAEENVKRGPSKRAGKTTRTDFLGAVDENGKVVFEKLLEFAQAHGMPIQWGSRGFSLNADLDGTHIAVFFCYPPASVYKQSIYTNRAGISTRTLVPDDEISRMWNLAQATGLFRPAVDEMKCLINRPFTEADVDKILAWCEEAAATIARHGLKE
jgi:hypothetical protein